MLDLSTPGRLGGAPTLERFHDRPGWTLHMRAVEHADERTLEREIVIFTAADDGTYHRTHEHHVLQLYPPDEVLGRLRAAGFDACVEPLQSDNSPPSGWISVVARKPAS